MSRKQSIYGVDLAYIHDVGFGDFARRCVPGILDLLAAAGITSGSVIELGCGSGILAAQLAAAGYQVRGVDVSAEMIAMASQRVPAGDFHLGSLWDYRFPRCDAVLALGEVLCYRTGEPGRGPHLGQLLRKIHQSLEPGGLLIFDLAEIGLDQGRRPSAVEGSDWACLVRYEYLAGKEQLLRHITTFRREGELYRRSHERHLVQLYDTSNVTALLRKIGFRVRRIRQLADFPLLPQRVGLVARKADS